MKKGRLLVEELDGSELPRGTCLPAVLNFPELGFVFFLQFGDTQAILVWNFGLLDDLYFLR